MARISPKIEIINHFDNLINRIDIDIDTSLEMFNDQQLISEILKSTEEKYFRNRYIFTIDFFKTIDSSKQKLDSCEESTKVVDYLKQVRLKTIEELRKAQEDKIEYYKLNSERFKGEQINEKSIDELKSELFAEKFYFQVDFKQSKERLWPFNIFTFVTDFYMSPSDIESLEKLINYEEEPFDQVPVFDYKMVFIGLLFKNFIDNLLNFPNHVIHVRKKDVLNIETIEFQHEYSAVNLTSSSSIDLSKLDDLRLIYQFGKTCSNLVKFNLEGLSSLNTLHLGANTAEVDFSIKNLPSLTKLSLSISGTIDQDIVTGLFEQLPYIQELYFKGNLSFFNLDNLVNLKKLVLSGIIDEKFNLELFNNLCNQLEDIRIYLTNINENTYIKLFLGYTFPFLFYFSLSFLRTRRFKKEYINGFPKLKQLNISECKIQLIEHDSFSNLEQLCSLNLSSNRIEFIEDNAFSNLKNLQQVDLSYNNLFDFDKKSVDLIESAMLKI